MLDEADRLLDLGFQNSLDNILKLLPRQRRTGLFSATQTKEVENLVRAGLRNPVVVSVKEKVGHSVSTPATLTNFYTICTADAKLDLLVGFIQQEGADKKFIIFTSNCACVEWFHRILSKVLGSVFCLYGKMGKKRHKVLEKFRRSESGVLLCTDVMARGIDVPEVDWVVQLDPPSNAAAFVHRVGRTARCGRQGSSLLMLLPSEDAYVEFIQKNQKVDLVERPIDWEPVDTISIAHSIQLKDRTNFDLANRAFVSFIKSYAKHECSLILRVKDLPMGLLAKGFGLLRLPKMPELKNADVSGFVPKRMDYNQITYAEKNKEASRQKKLQIYFETNEWPSKNAKKRCIPTTPWELSKKRKVDKKERRKTRHEKNEKRTLSGVPKRKKRSKVSEEDIAALAKDIALIKKMKKKKISSEDFEKEFAGLDA